MEQNNAVTLFEEKRGEMMEYLTKRQKKVLCWIVSVAAVYLGFQYLLPLFLPFLFAYFIAWILRPFAALLQRRLHLPLMVGGGIGLLALLLGAGSGIYFLGRMFVTQLSEFFKNFPVYQSYLQNQVEGICCGCDRFFRLPEGTIFQTFSTGMESIGVQIREKLLPAMTKRTLKFAADMAVFAGTVVITLTSVLLWIKDMEEYKRGLKRSEFYPEVHRITKQLSETGIAYLKTQLIVMGIIAALCSAALFLIKNPYALILGTAIAVFDAFPILGLGLILVPWILIELLTKDFFSAAVLGTLFVLCQMVRELLEPKLLGGKLGIPPIYSMIAMYLGVQLFGIWGFFLGPVGYVILRTINRGVDF